MSQGNDWCGFRFSNMLKYKNIFNPFGFLKDLKRKDHTPAFGALDIFKYIGPGLLVTVGFIDPGNWAANIASWFKFWLFASLDCYSVNNYAYNSAT